MELANVTFQDEDGNIKVKIDHEKCITCGRCISACKHEARFFNDDTEQFFDDLKNGVKISIIAAPSIRTNFPEHKKLFTYLKQLGVKMIYDVSLGADICIWGHIKHLQTVKEKRLITQPCPVIVSYCEMFRHDLLKWLSPIHSPMACVSIYIKKYLGSTDRIAALSPCIAKSNEFAATGLAQYNITFTKLLEYLQENNITLPKKETDFDFPQTGLGTLFPLPGGLKENIDFFTDNKLFISNAEGFSVYDKLDQYIEVSDDILPDVYDVLNCDEGCNIGPASTHDKTVFDIDKSMNNVRNHASHELKKEHYETIYKAYDDLFELSDFIREYKPFTTDFPQISENDIESAFMMLGKKSYEQQNVDCSACGSQTCHDMARKIALDVNIPINCIVKSMEDARTEHNNYLAAHSQLLYTVNIAQKASRAKSDFLASMSHEIRTPMNAIIGMSEILEHEQLSEQQASYVKDIRISAHSLLGIINGILDMSKIEAGKLELNPVDYNFNQFSDNIVSMFTHVSNSKGLEFKYRTEGDIPEYLYGDDIRLRQVLTNICGNAVKFTQSGHIMLTIIHDHDDNKMTIKIEDTGVGIKEEDLPKLFNAFEQLDKVKNRSVVGTGLGLSICKSLVEMMGGTIEVESKYGHGTTFTIILPIVISNDEDIRINETEKEELTISAPDAKILITDDNEFNLKVTSGLLSLMEIEAETAISGFKAIEMVKQKDYDIVFMDHMMPEMDGIETVAKIRALGGKFLNLTIVALTANAIKSARQMFIDNDFDDFLSKPIDMFELREIVKRYLPPDKVTLIKNTEASGSTSSKEDDLRKKSIATFVKENRNAFLNITSALSSQDIQKAHRIAHTVKSAAGYLERKKLQEAAAVLEESFSGGVAKHTPHQLRIFQSELSSALFDLENVLKELEGDKPEAAQMSKDEIKSLLTELEPLLKGDDFAAISFADKIRKVQGLELLAELIEDYDFANALVLLEKYISE